MESPTRKRILIMQKQKFMQFYRYINDDKSADLETLSCKGILIMPQQEGKSIALSLLWDLLTWSHWSTKGSS
jgi:hypothetical protein